MINLPPTKSNLLSLKSQIFVIEEGHDLLTQKKDAILIELMQYLYDFDELKKKLQVLLEKFLNNLRQYKFNKGLEAFELVKLSVQGKFKEHITERSIMGVLVSKVVIDGEAPCPCIGLFDSFIFLDEIKQKKEEFIDILLQYISKFSSIKRLLGELRKTQRRVKALEEIFIPDYKKTIKKIKNVLEENERDEFIRRKKCKHVT